MTRILQSVFRSQLDALLSADADELSRHRREWMVKQAVEKYGKDKGLTVSVDVTGDGGKYYQLSTVATDFVEEYSKVVAIEYPAQAVSADENPVYLSPADWDDDYRDGSNVRFLFFPNHSPGSSETARVRHTIPVRWQASSTTSAISQVAHGFSVDDFVYYDDETTGTPWKAANDARLGTHKITVVTDADNATAAELDADISQADFFAVCSLAASYACHAIGTRYARTNDSSIALDSVDHGTRSDRFFAAARRHQAAYAEHMGIGKENEQAAATPDGEFISYGTRPNNGRGFIFK